MTSQGTDVAGIRWLLAEARAWIADCKWEDVADDADVAALTDTQVQAGIEKHYDGGWEQFAADNAAVLGSAAVPSSAARTETMRFRVSREEKQRIMALAAAAGVGYSEYVRIRVLDGPRGEG